MMEHDTFPKLLREKSLRWGENKVAIREKDYGLWNIVTWKAYYEQVKSFALGLKSLGFERGEHVAIIGNNEPEWVYAELAVQSLGGVVIGIYQDSTPPEVKYIVEKSDAVYVIAEDQEQVDKLLEIQDEIPLVRKVVYWDPKGMRNYGDAILISFQEVQRAGKAYEKSHPDLFEKEIDQGGPDDIAAILTTSGTTSLPKLAMLSHRNMLTMAENLLTKMDAMYPADEYVSCLPLAWVGEQMISISGAMLIGFTVNFPEAPTTVQENIREIAPHIMFAPPRIWEEMLSTIQVKIEDASWLKKLIYRKLMPVGYKMADFRFDKQRPTLKWKILYQIGRLLLFRTLKDRIGLPRIRNVYTGGAALGPDVFRFYHAIGVNLKQIYGQTEIAGISVVH
ncbi:MAG: AMP-binding protein, partial [Candidatus Poribacteria bacterium]|nr:AMP-binding protein [Candidatus Poribacteria bacterium]